MNDLFSPESYKPERRMLIDGQLVDASNGATFENINPATEEVLGVVADGTNEDMQRAITAARRAFDETDWSTNHEFRKRCLLQLKAGIESEKEAFRHELVQEVGTPIMLTYSAQLDWPLEDAFSWPANMIDEYPWERVLPDNELGGVRSKRKVRKEALGVIGAIIPWNYPFEVTANKLGTILATGNTVIIKPAPDTPWNATRLGRIIAEKTDIPAGVVNVVTSSDHLVGEALTLDPRVDMISFTGSTLTGKRVMEKGAATLKRVFLELGGKSAMIVLDDADFSTVLPTAAGTCAHAGQGCAMQTRILLPRSRYDEGVAILTAVMQNIPYGDPKDPNNLMGPQVSKLQQSRVLEYIEKGKAEGAKAVVGGGRPQHLHKGWFVEPTLFVDVENSMVIAQEEIFGPVIVVIAFDDDEDAIRIANDSKYGLSGGIWSGSLERGMKVADCIRTGSIAVNGGVWYGADAPYGGYKSSGVGRQNGIEGFNQHVETKLVGWVE